MKIRAAISIENKIVVNSKSEIPSEEKKENEFDIETLERICSKYLKTQKSEHLHAESKKENIFT